MIVRFKGGPFDGFQQTVLGEDDPRLQPQVALPVSISVIERVTGIYKTRIVKQLSSVAIYGLVSGEYHFRQSIKATWQDQRRYEQNILNLRAE